MTRTGPLHLRLNETWTAALIGGGLSIPATLGGLWLSGTESELVLDAVFFGGLLAGVLATRWTDSSGSAAGFRAGLIGGLPGVVLLSEMVYAAGALEGPLWFQVIALVGTVGTVTLVLFVVSGIAGWTGGRVGNWAAQKLGFEGPPTQET